MYIITNKTYQPIKLIGNILIKKRSKIEVEKLTPQMNNLIKSNLLSCKKA